jgi:hypothetical protein
VNSRNCLYVFCFSNDVLRLKKGIVHATLNFRILEMASDVAFDKLDLCANSICLAQFHLIGCVIAYSACF